MASDALGNPVRWQLTGGEVHDITEAPALIEGLDAEQVIADKAYDSDAFIAIVLAAGAQPPVLKIHDDDAELALEAGPMI